MCDSESWYRIAELLVRQSAGLLTKKETEELEQWGKEDPQNEQMVRNFVLEGDLQEEFQQWQQVDYVRPLAEMQQRVRTERRRISNNWLRAVAAAVVLIVTAGGIGWLLRPQQAIPLQTAGITKVEPGRPLLHLAKGKVILVDSLAATTDESGGCIAKSDAGQLIYSSKAGKPERLVYHTLEIPKGAEYSVLLEDSTEVWLNAGSKLSYPVVFVGKQREVRLEGEAYFKVAKDPDRPFRVILQKQTIEVLGTEFNVSAYPAENCYTTLVNGKIKVGTQQGENKILTPGMQCIQKTDGSVFTRKVKVGDIVSWRQGVFVLEEQSLKEIMSKLERWYDFSVFYQEEKVKNITFKGWVPRYAAFRDILHILEETGGIHFRIEGNIILVSG